MANITAKDVAALRAQTGLLTKLCNHACGNSSHFYILSLFRNFERF